MAPTRIATSRRARMGSIAMMAEAPAIRAPCTALRPRGPQPTTATVAPGWMVISVCDTVAPKPATLTQLQTISRSTTGAFVKMGTIHSSKVTINSASPPICEFSYTGVPSAMSAIGTRSSAPIALRN